MLRALAIVRRERTEATLEVFGDGPDRPRLEALAAALGVANAVTFRGHVPHHAVFDALTRAELFVFLSRDPTDRLPNVVKEAMGCGAACVASDTRGIDELIADPERGRVVPMGDAPAAAAAALALLADRDEARAVRAAAHGFLLQHFDLRRTTEAYVRRWAAAVAERAAPAGVPRTAGAREPARQVP